MGVLTGESWVESAQDAALGRPLAGLPFCVFAGDGGRARVGVGIGDRVLDVRECGRLGLLEGLPGEVIAACEAERLNELIGCGADSGAALRARLVELLGAEVHRGATERALVGLDGLELRRPAAVGNFTDFYASIEHAERVGRLFRPERPLLENYRHVPIGYHGRASSVVVSGTPVRRPMGQVRAAGEAGPRFAPTAQLDYEMELGAYVYGGNALGEAIAIGEAAGQVFGVSLVNDWSARDVQAWESQPLGPFLGKSFQTSVGAWVMPWAAVETFRAPLRRRAEMDPEVLAYLRPARDAAWTVAVTVEAWIATAAMRAGGAGPVLLGRSSVAGLYWSFAQMIAHHTSNGCNLEAGDLLATGTVSGPGAGERGCLLEMTGRGATPVAVGAGETRVFLEDGDEVVLRGFCEGEGRRRISLGECRGVVTAAS